MAMAITHRVKSSCEPVLTVRIKIQGRTRLPIITMEATKPTTSVAVPKICPDNWVKEMDSLADNVSMVGNKTSKSTVTRS